MQLERKQKWKETESSDFAAGKGLLNNGYGQVNGFHEQQGSNKGKVHTAILFRQ